MLLEVTKLRESDGIYTSVITETQKDALIDVMCEGGWGGERWRGEE